MEKFYLSNLKILLVEDDEVLREILFRYLQENAQKIYTATNGQEALEMFKLYQPDIVVTDIHMPIMDGLTLAQKIKEINKAIPVIVITGDSDHESMSKAITLGINGYAIKPVTKEKILTCLEPIAKNIEDIKSLKANQQLLQEYKKAVDAGSIVSKADLRGIITYVNDAFCKISKYSKEELLGKNHNIVRDPEIPKEVYKELWDTISSKKVWQGEIRNLAKDGSHYYVAATIVPILNEHNEITEYISLRQDITPLEELNISLEKRVADEVAKNREKDAKHIQSLHAFLDHSPNPIIVYKKGKVEFANKEFMKLLKDEHSDISNTDFNLDSIFEKKQGYISSLSELNPTITTNKVSVTMKVGRKIFYLIVDNVPDIDGKVLQMYTFNNITLIEYQQLKINHYSNRLEDFIKKINKQKYEKIPSQEETTTSSTTEPLVQEAPKEKRVLSSSEKEVLKRSRKDVAVSSQEYSNEIDDYVLEEIQELYDIEGEIEALISDYSDTFKIESLQKISTKLIKYASVIAKLFGFEDLSFAIDSLANILYNLQENELDETKNKKVVLFLSNIIYDLSSWRKTVFIEQSANDIHYLDASLFSTILQFELIFQNAELSVEDDDEDDFELF